ncbi:MAG: CPBP family intramembrane metalloprotease [Deltaproteobacteria bacterium]|nr:MAG: CPBP family intramembrane metalloprotease [Deltaproteobacteria bacterium]
MQHATSPHPNNRVVLIFVGCLVLLEIAFLAFLNVSRTNLRYFNYVMFLPAISAWVAWLSVGQWKEMFAPLKLSLQPKGYLFAILYPVGFLLFLCGLVWALGLGEYQPHKSWYAPPFRNLYGLVMAICLVLGEEWGWRGFLLPTLTARLGRFQAAFWVGVAWALFHAPVVFLLAVHLKTANPYLLIIIHMATVLVFSFPFAYAYLKTRSVWAPVLFHYIWNWLNPVWLGNLYRNQSGLFKGNLLLINGEGIFGFVLTLFFVAWFWRKQSDIKPPTTPMQATPESSPS